MNAQIGAIEILGDIDTETYPMSKKRHTSEFLRQFPHLRVRTNMWGLMARVRNSCSKATHDFFQDRGFMYVRWSRTWWFRVRIWKINYVGNGNK